MVLDKRLLLNSVDSVPELIGEQINKSLQESFPGVAAPINVYPLVDTARGDYCSDVALEVARKERVDPRQITQRLLKSLTAENGFTWSEERGFINVAIADYRLWLPVATELPTMHEGIHHILVLAGSPSLNGLSLFRLIARAALQARVLQALGYDVRLTLVGPDEDLVLPSASHFHDVMQFCLRTESHDFLGHEVLIGRIEEHLRTTNQDKTSLWVLPALFELRAFVSAIQEWQKPQAVRLRVYSIQGGSYGTQSAPRLSHCSSFHASDLWNLALNICGPENLDDFDIESARLPERANVLWYLRQTLDRMERLGIGAEGGMLPPHQKTELIKKIHDYGSDLLPVERFLLQRVACFQLFFEQAGTHGRVLELWQALRTSLDSVNKVLNDPEMQRHFQAGHASPLCLIILTSARYWFSSMLTCMKLLEVESHVVA